MRIRLRPKTEPFVRFLGQARGVLGVWAKVAGAFAVLSILFGPFAPLGVVVFLLTLGVPVLLLVLWGQALDTELGWTELDGGPW